MSKNIKALYHKKAMHDGSGLGICYEFNESANAIYLLEETVFRLARQLVKGDSFNIDYSKMEMQAMYKVDIKSHAFPISSIEGSCDGETTYITVHYQNGSENYFEIPLT